MLSVLDCLIHNIEIFTSIRVLNNFYFYGLIINTFKENIEIVMSNCFNYFECSILHILPQNLVNLALIISEIYLDSH